MAPLRPGRGSLVLGPTGRESLVLGPMGGGPWCWVPRVLPGSSLTCCSSNSVENLWVTDEISREKEKEPPPYLESRAAA